MAEYYTTTRWKVGHELGRIFHAAGIVTSVHIEGRRTRTPEATFHSLRHTFVSIVSSQTHLAEGTIKELVGHSDSMDTFGVYKHQVEGELAQAADIINLTFERLKTAEQ